MIKDWEKLCHLQFKARWYGTQEEKKLFSLDDNEVIRMGVYYETMVIGSGVHNKTLTKSDLTPKELKSVKLEYVEQQAKFTREYLKALPGKKAAVQQELTASFERDGATYFISGNLDINWRWNDGRAAIIDLKTTGDIEADWGDFAWGDVHSMDKLQLKQYRLLYELNFGEVPETYFFVADISKRMKFTPFQIELDEWDIEEHKERIVKVYQEISNSLLLDFWEPKPSFNRCKSCPLNETCQYQQKFPEIVHVLK